MASLMLRCSNAYRKERKLRKDEIHCTYASMIITTQSGTLLQVK